MGSTKSRTPAGQGGFKHRSPYGPDCHARGDQCGGLCHGAEGLSVLRRDPTFNVIFSDVVMPGDVDGFRVARAAKRLRPAIKILMTSGYPFPKGRVEQGDLELPLLKKPYRRSNLVEALSRLKVIAVPDCG